MSDMETFQRQGKNAEHVSFVLRQSQTDGMRVHRTPLVRWLIEEVCQHLASVFAHLESTRLFSVHTLSRFKAQF